MTETEALTRRDDELLMGDEGDDPIDGVRSRDELPRDARGRVIGTWHLASMSLAHGEEPDARVFEAGAALEGDLVDRAIALGCSVRPGRDEAPQIES